MPLAHAATTHALLQVALDLCVTEGEERALIESLPDWKAGPDFPRWRLLAQVLAQAKPEWTLELFRRSAALPLEMDWSNWAHHLHRNPSPAALEPISAAMEKATDSQLQDFLKLVVKSPVAPLLSGWLRVLHSEDPVLVRTAVDRLKQDGRPLPPILPVLESMRKRWDGDLELAAGFDALIGLNRAGQGSRGFPPDGTREADVIAEVMLEQLPPDNDRRGVEAFVLPDGQIYVRVHLQLIRLAAAGRDRAVWSLPRNADLGFTFLGTGLQEEMLVGLSWGNFTLYVLRHGESALRRFEPSLDDDEGPGYAIGTDGHRYGWRGTAWKMSHFENDPGHDKPFAYLADRDKLRISEIKPGSFPKMQTLPGARISTDRGKRPEIQFNFHVDGAFRVCSDLGLAIASGDGSNPVRGLGRGDGELAIYVELFASKLCRVYLWEAAEVEVPADIWGPVHEGA